MTPREREIAALAMSGCGHGRGQSAGKILSAMRTDNIKLLLTVPEVEALLAVVDQILAMHEAIIRSEVRIDRYGKKLRNPLSAQRPGSQRDGQDLHNASSRLLLQPVEN